MYILIHHVSSSHPDSHFSTVLPIHWSLPVLPSRCSALMKHNLVYLPLLNYTQECKTIFYCLHTCVCHTLIKSTLLHFFSSSFPIPTHNISLLMLFAQLLTQLNQLSDALVQNHLLEDLKSLFWITFLKRADSQYTSNHQLSIVSQLGVGFHQPPTTRVKISANLILGKF